MTTVCLIDYGMGNLRSVGKALEACGATVEHVTAGAQLTGEHPVVMPGVGAFGDAMSALAERDLVEPLRAHLAADRPYLGICLGLQLLFEIGEEGGEQIAGLGLLRGRVARFEGGVVNGERLKVPHMGWNSVQPTRADPLLDGLAAGTYAYFLHSYRALPARAEDVLATTHYGEDFCSAVARGNVRATQFHPEKSQAVGKQLLTRFLALVA